MTATFNSLVVFAAVARCSCVQLAPLHVFALVCPCDAQERHAEALASRAPPAVVKDLEERVAQLVQELQARASLLDRAKVRAIWHIYSINTYFIKVQLFKSVAAGVSYQV